MLRKAALGTLVAFLASSVWLWLAYSHAARSNSWTPVPAKVVGNDVERSMRGRTKGLTSTVAYNVDGVDYEAVVDTYLVGNDVEVYVDPEDPTAVVGERGATIQVLFRPVVVTGATALFAIVLVLIAFSPKDD